MTAGVVPDRGIETPSGLLKLDGHKLPWHYDRVQAWAAGERFAPITVDMALTRACGASCRFCYAMMQESQTRHTITPSKALELADDFAEIGVRSVALISDGESTLSKAYVPFVQRLKSNGLDVGNATNGWELTPDKAEAVLPHMTWMRFTVGGGTPEGFSKIMYKGPEHTQVFDRAMSHIRYAVALKQRLNLPVTLGIQMVLMPEFHDEIIPFAKLGLELGVDYAIIKHCSDDEFHTLGVDYAKYEAMYPTLLEAEALSTDKTKVVVKWDKITESVPPYNRFYGPPFLLQLSGSGLIAPCGMMFGARYSKFHIGDLTQERFKDVFQSDRYWRVMNYLASPAYDAQTMMGTLIVQHYVSKALDRHVKGIERIRPANSLDPKPLHVNFV